MSASIQTNGNNGIVTWQISLQPYTYDTSDAGASVDMDGLGTRCYAIQTTNTEAGALTGKIQESANGSDWTDISGASFAEVDEQSIQAITFVRAQRYLRHYRSMTGEIYACCIIGG